MIYDSGQIHPGLTFTVSLPVVAIRTQFIEVSNDALRVGDNVTLKCSLADDANASDVANYVWYLNSESLEEEILSIFSQPRRDFVSFFPFLLSFVVAPLV